ncbi:MAG TPA: methionine--tRNA ligase [Alphaproteobacteria bacterium]|nr:methionine--tRNA ligase [Alphaproteobacteria bacterium]
MTKKPFYITTAISYVNGLPHLGHAYEAILTDVMARYQRLEGRDVMFLTGTDEHGEKVAKTAEKNGVAPLAFADQNAEAFREMSRKLNISHDDFIRTTEPRHYKAAQAIWEKLAGTGDIYLNKYEGWYSIREEGYFTEDELTTDPHTGTKLTPNGTEVTWVEEPSYFFKLSAYTDKLLKLYEEHPEFIQPAARRNEIISFVKGGLKDLSVSRDKSRLHWGIPVPGDDKHVMYVWLDALTNYITAPGYPDMDSDSFKKFWPADFHVIGKDIIRFHCVYWPAFLMSAGVELPKTVFAHGFINVQGVKMSKSLGNVLSPDNLVETYGLDPMRYLLMREIPHGQDGNFSHDHAIARINADLANGLGNLVQRTLSMIHKNCGENIPAPQPFTDADKALLDKAYAMPAAIRDSFNRFEFHRGLEEIWRVVAEANGYIDAQAPWTLKKEDPVRMETVLYVLAETIRCLGLIIQPVVPNSAMKILDQLVIPENARGYEHLNAAYALKPGTSIPAPQGVFPRIVEAEEAA